MAIKTPLARHHNGLQQKKKARRRRNRKEMQWIPDKHLFNIGLPVSHQQTNGSGREPSLEYCKQLGLFSNKTNLFVG